MGQTSPQGPGPGLAKFTGPGLDLPIDSLVTDTITVLLSTENGYKLKDPITFKPEVLNGKYYSVDLQVILAIFLMKSRLVSNSS